MTPRLIFYFTGTGNSLYVARRLAAGDAEPVSIAQALRRGTADYAVGEIGFVFPSYGQKAPGIVQDFIRANRFRADYFFTVITYGYRNSNAADLWQRFAARSLGVRFDYVRSVLMVDNYLPEFNMDRQASYDKKVDEQLARVRGEIDRRLAFVDPFTEADCQWHDALEERLGTVGLEKPFIRRSETLFLVGPACNGCGTCTRVCPHGNWRLVEEPAVTTPGQESARQQAQDMARQEQSTVRQQAPDPTRCAVCAGSCETRVAVCSGLCETCLACIQNCPQRAITMPGERNPAARYRHPAVSLADLIAANNQALV